MKTFILSFILILTTSVFSQITYDTVSVKNVGPGVRHIEINASTPWTIDVLEIDITNPFLKIQTVKSNDKLQAGREKTSSMSQRINSVGHWAVGGVNGDFFDLGTGRPNNTQIVKGEILRREHGVLPSVSFDFNNKMILENHVYSAKIIKSGNLSTDVDDINAVRGSNNLILYNSFYSNSTGTDNSGTELIITPINGWFANDTLICIIDSIAVNQGNHALPIGKMVISASGSKAAFFNTLIKNDTIKLIQNLLPGLPKLTSSIGGHPYVVKNGAVHNFDLNDPFVTARHPRTAVGMNIDSTKYFFITVDGRQLTSSGMNLTELANFMLMIGCYQGINLDGGGSTTMVVRNEVVNSPSDAEGERIVANALFIVSTAPIGSIHYLNINPSNNKVFIGKQIQFTVEGQDQYYNPVTLNPNLVQFSLSNNNLGTINAEGIFTAGTNHDSGYVIVNYNNIKDSVFVVVKGISSFKVTPAYAVVDNSQIISFKVKVHDTDGEEQQIASNLINWTSTNTGVGNIDIAGQFQGILNGTTKIIGNYLGIKDTATVSVEIGYGTNVIDTIESLNNYLFDWQNIDSVYSNIVLSDSVSTAGEFSIKLDYRFTYTTGMFNWVFLRTNLPLYGVPDSLMVDFLSDGANHRVFFDLEDYEGRVYRIFTHKLANNNGVFETLRAALPRSNVNYPLILKSITIPLGSTQINGNEYTGKVFIDRLRTKYANVTNIENEEIIINNYFLSQNFPNPFNPSTTIEYIIAKDNGAKQSVLLKVYDILGNEIATLVNEEKEAGNYSVKFSARDLASGIYYYTLRAGEFEETKKMIFLK